MWRFLKYSFIIATFVIAYLLFQYLHFLKTPLSIPENGFVLDILPKTSVRAIRNSLVQAGILDNSNFFVCYVQIKNLKKQIKAGEYQLNPGLTVKELLQLLISHKVIQHSITIIEGWNFDQLLTTIRSHPKINSTISTTLSTPQYPELMHSICGETIHPEGQFFPDTYWFEKGTTDIDLLKRAYLRMQKKLVFAWEARDKDVPYKSPYEALIMASIIEKESDKLNEYHEIAGVYVRRFIKKMLLQADPTVIYGLKETYQGPLTLEHLKMQSLYNTYKVIGLPPTPICLPSFAAIEAAVHPAAGETLYFVATGTGGHYFSKTLVEHSAAVARYRKFQKSKRE